MSFVQDRTVKLCIATDVAVRCQEHAEAHGFPLNLTQAVNAALRNHMNAISVSKDNNDRTKS